MSEQSDIQDDILALGGFYLRMEDAADGTRVDSGPNGQDFTDNNGVGQTTGKVDNCADFVRANNEFLTRAREAANMADDADWSFWCWVKFDVVNGNIHTIADTGNGTWALAEFGNLLFQIQGGAHGWNIAEDIPLSVVADTWYFIAIGNRAATKTLWASVDGGTKVTDTYTGTVTFGDPWRIGSLTGSATHAHDGPIDEVGFIKRELTVGEIDYLYNDGDGVNLYASPPATGNRRRRLLLQRAG